MLTETLEKGLAGYRIGPKIRALRTSKKLGLVQLGEHSGLSPAMLSKIERGQLFPTLPTLLRIALVFGVGLEHFFVGDGNSPSYALVRHQERLRFPDRPDADAPSYFFESLDFPLNDRRMEAFHTEFQASAHGSDPHDHPGEEIVHLLNGELAVTIIEEEIVLAAGDTIHFDSGQAHSYRRIGNGRCAAIVVVTAQRPGA